MTYCIVHSTHPAEAEAEAECHCFVQDPTARHLPSPGSFFAVGLYRCHCGLEFVGDPGGGSKPPHAAHPTPEFLGQFPVRAV